MYRQLLLAAIVPFALGQGAQDERRQLLTALKPATRSFHNSGSAATEARRRLQASTGDDADARRRLAEYSYSYAARPTLAPTSETRTPTASAAPTRTETYAPTRMTEAPSYAPTTDTYAPTATPMVMDASFGGFFGAVSCKGRVMTDSGDSSIRTAVTAWFSNAATATTIYGHISTWCTGEVTDMSCLFGNWSVDLVMDMPSMFYGTKVFNQDISSWNVAKVTDMGFMFSYASSFDQNLDWCVDYDVVLSNVFRDTKCATTSCGVTKHVGGCPP